MGRPPPRLRAVRAGWCPPIRRAHYLRHLALIRELGVAAGARYFVSRVDPRRFPDAGAARRWARLAIRRAAATPWTALLPR